MSHKGYRMYTFKEVVEKLGDAQVVGGRIIVYRGGKHVDVGRVASETGVFILTPAGHELLNAVAEPAPVVDAPVVDAPVVEAPAPKPAKKAGKAAKAAAEPDLGDLSDLDFEE